jgi:hypothetical protein
MAFEFLGDMGLKAHHKPQKMQQNQDFVSPEQSWRVSLEGN